MTIYILDYQTSYYRKTDDKALEKVRMELPQTTERMLDRVYYGFAEFMHSMKMVIKGDRVIGCYFSDKHNYYLDKEKPEDAVVFNTLEDFLDSANHFSSNVWDD